MAVPKRRTSKQRKRTRKANWKLSLPGISECPQCKQPVLSHRACKSCGYYNGVKVIPDKVKKAAE
ncbi:MAG: 50S ribosomal protein L32 [Eubacteriales bacterium]